MNKIALLFVFLLTACPNKQDAVIPLKRTKLPAIASPQPEPASLTFLSKEQREAIYFSASLEREAIKLLTKNPSFDDLTLLSVLSFAVETRAGVKKSSPPKLDCSRYEFVPDSGNNRSVLVFKTCTKPNILIAAVNQGLSVNELQVKFFIKEWASVVGLSAALTGSDIICDMKTQSKRLEKLDCQNWLRTITANQTSAEEIRLTTFVFNRFEKNQFVLQGGVFRDLVERRKVEIRVPLEGKIRMIEKELEVIDQFADRIEPQESRTGRIQIQGVGNEKEIEKAKAEQKNSGQKGDGENQGEIPNEQNLGVQNSEYGGIPPAPPPQSEQPQQPRSR